MDKNIIIADADALIAIINSNDSNNQKAVETLQRLEQLKIEIFFPITAISEAITSAQRKIADPKLAKALVEIAISGDINALEVESDIIIQAAKLYNPTSSKQNTFFDAIIAAIAIRNNAVAVFSFDKWYKSQGLKLAAEL